MSATAPAPASVPARGWRETANVVGQERESFLREGKEVFIIGAHYGLVGELSFYLPEARAHVSDTPLVYYESSDRPVNQFYFWPGYQPRAGQNAIYVREENEPSPAPPRLAKEFDSVTDLGLRTVVYRGRIFRTLHLFGCRNLHADGKAPN